MSYTKTGSSITVTEGNGIDIDNSNPSAPVVNVDPSELSFLQGITAGTNITIDYTNPVVPIISSTAGGGGVGDGGVTTLTTIGNTPNFNAGNIVGTTLNLEPASAAFGGVVTTVAQEFAGVKTFTNGIVTDTVTSGPSNATAFVGPYGASVTIAHNNFGGHGTTLTSTLLVVPTTLRFPRSDGIIPLFVNGQGAGFDGNIILTPAMMGAEPSLGVPPVNGYVLSSLTDGTRSWIAPASGGGADTTTASNGLTETIDNIKLGGTLTDATTTIATGSNRLVITGAHTVFDAVLRVTNTGSGYALRAEGTGNNVPTLYATAQGTAAVALAGTATGSQTDGVFGGSDVRYGGRFESYTGIPISAKRTSGTTGVDTALVLHKLIIGAPSPTMNNGMGVGIDFNLDKTGLYDGDQVSSRIASIWKDITTFKSEFSVTGTNSGTLSKVFAVDGIGAATLNKYGAGTFTGTATRNLQVDASGNIIEGALGGGADATTASNGLTEVGDNIKWGGTLTENTVITATTFQTNINGSGPQQLFNLWNSGSGHCFTAAATGGGTAIGANTSTGTALTISSTGGAPFSMQGALAGNLQVSNAADSSVSNVLTIGHISSVGSPTIGYGTRLTFNIDRPGGIGPFAGTTLDSVWDNVTPTFTSRFKIGGVAASVTNNVFEVIGTGVVNLPFYGDGTITGTPTFGAAFDVNGKLIEVALGGGGGATANNGLTATAGNVQLGGTLIQNTNISGATFGLNVTNNSNVEETMTISNSGGPAVYIGSGASAHTCSIENLGSGMAISAFANGQTEFLTANYFIGNNIGIVAGFGRTSQTAVANGIGSGISFVVENSVGNNRSTGIIAAKLTNITDGAETSELVFQCTQANTMQEVLKLSNAGRVTLPKGLLDFVDDAAASVGGILVNELYRTGSVVKIRVT